MNSAKSFSIVMADDDPDDQFLVKRAIEDINIAHDFVSVNNGRQLLDLLASTGTFADANIQADCILLDLNMPLIDGFEALSTIKASPLLKHIPVYVLSTSRSDKDKERSLRLGAMGFYVKPNKYADLKNILGEIFVKTLHPGPGQLYN